MTDELQERLRRVRFLVCDVDGVLTDGMIGFDADGRPFRAFHAHDATALTMWRLAGYGSALVTGLASKAVEAIADIWQCAECRQWVCDKASVCREIAANQGLTLDEIAFIGDDLIDLTAGRIVGLSAAVADAVPEFKAEAHLALQAPGGRGAVRELVYAVFHAQGRYDEVLATYCARKNTGGPPARAGN